MIRIESPPVMGIPAGPVRDMFATLLRNDQALAKMDFATKADIEKLHRLIGQNEVRTERTVTKIVQLTPPPVAQAVDALPVVSGTADEIWTLSAAPLNTAGKPASLQIINNSPGSSSTVHVVNGSGGDPLNYAQINIYGTYVYPAAQMNLGFGGFLNFVTRNLAGTNIQGAFVNGGLIGTTAGAERGDLDFGIYGPHPSGSGNNTPRIIALRAEASGTLSLTVDQDNKWDLGDSVGRWRKGFFGDTVQCGGLDLNFNSSAPWVARLANPSSQIFPGPYGTLAGYMRFFWNAVPVHVPCYVLP